MKLTVVDGGTGDGHRGDGGGDGGGNDGRPKVGPCRTSISDGIMPYALTGQALDDVLKGFARTLEQLLDDGWHLTIAVYQGDRCREYDGYASYALARHAGNCDRITVTAWGTITDDRDDAAISAVEAAHIRWHSDGKSLSAGIDLRAGSDPSHIYCTAPTRQLCDMVVDPVMAVLTKSALPMQVRDADGDDASLKEELARIRSLFPAPPRRRRSMPDRMRMRAWTTTGMTAALGVLILALSAGDRQEWRPVMILLWLVIVASIMFRGVAAAEHRERTDDPFADRMDAALEKVRSEYEVKRDIAALRASYGIPNPENRAASTISLGT